MLAPNLGREGDNFPVAEAVLTGDLSHSSKHPKKLSGRISPALSVPVDFEKSSIERPLGIGLDENGGRFVCRLGHPYTLLIRGFGSPQRPEKLTKVNGAKS